MDILAFLLSTTGGIVILVLGLFLWYFMGKGTGANAQKFNTGGKLLAMVGALILIIPAIGIAGTPAQTVAPDGEIETDYTIVWAVDSTSIKSKNFLKVILIEEKTAVISGDFSQTDEVGSGEYALEWDDEGNTVGVTVVNTCTALSACTFSGCDYFILISLPISVRDAFSFTNTITAEFTSTWDQGARITSVLGAKVDSDILSWGVQSNRTGVNVPFVDPSPLNIPGLIWVDGAGTNKGIGDPSATSLNEFSPGESVTSAGLYFAVNEDSYSTLYQVPTGLYTGIFDIVYSDDYGFSHTVVLTISLTNA